MSCSTDPSAMTCLLFALEEDCDAALAIQNAGCATCETDCGTADSGWAEKRQRWDGYWWFFKNDTKMTGITGIIDYTEEQYSESMDRDNDYNEE